MLQAGSTGNQTLRLNALSAIKQIQAEGEAVSQTQSKQIIQDTSNQPGHPFDPSVMLRKGIYDKVAAEIILQRYLNFHHSEAETLELETRV